MTAEQADTTRAENDMPPGLGVVLVAFHFPPENVIGSRRAAAMEAALSEAGHHVTVIAADIPGVKHVTELESESTVVVRPRWRRLRPLGRPSSPTPEWNPKAPISAATSAIFKSRLRSALARIRAECVEIPDAMAGWIVPGISEALRNAETNGADIVVVTVPPFSGLFVAAWSARKLKIPWLADYRDLWTPSEYYAQSEIRRIVDRFVEARILRSASAVTTVSGPLVEDLDGAFGIRAHEIRNGFEPVRAVEPADRRPLSTARCNLLFVGNNLYGDRRTPAILFRAAKELGLTATDIQFHFLGTSPASVWHLSEECGVSELLEFHPSVSYDESVRMQSRADALMLLMWNDRRERGTYSGKIFEYVAARRPILMSGLSESVAARLVLDHNLGYVGWDVVSAKVALSSLVASKESPDLLPDLPLPNWELSRESQMLKFVRLVEVTASRAHRGSAGGRRRAPAESIRTNACD